jgi:hypothetical protein
MELSFWERLTGDELIPIIAIAGGCLVGVIAIIAHQVRRIRESADLAALKRDLVAQGRPTEEIERICNAGLKKSE